MKKSVVAGIGAVILLIGAVIFYGQKLGKDAYCETLLRQASDTSSSTSSDVQDKAARLLEESYQQCKVTLENASLNLEGDLKNTALFLIAYSDDNPDRIEIFIKVLQAMRAEEKNINQLSVLTSIFRNGQNLSKPRAVKALLSKITPGKDSWNLRLFKVAVDLDPVQAMTFLKDLALNENSQSGNTSLPLTEFLLLLAKSEDDESRGYAEDRLKAAK